MNREAGKGPFSVPKEPLDLPAQDRQGGPLLAVIDAAGETFCYVGLMDCHGRDLAAAKARARRIAESLNKSEGFTGAQGHAEPIERLVKASRIALAANATAREPLGGMDELRKALEPFEGVAA